MTDKDDPKVINLADARQRLREEGDAEGEDQGLMFAFDLRDDLAEDDAPIGYVNGHVTVLLNPRDRTGVMFSPAAARKIGVSFIECALLAEQDEDGDKNKGA